MEKKLRKITLVFENCEVIDIPADHIKSIYIGKTYRQLFASQRFGSENAALPSYMRDGTIADDIRIILNREGNTQYGDNWNGVSRYLFDRITKWSDITSITVHYETPDDEWEEFAVLWKDKQGTKEENEYQESLIDDGKTHVIDKGLLVIVISKENKNELLGR